MHAQSKVGVHDVLDTAEIDLGVVGPLAMGGETQNFVHDLRGFDRANGWDHQLANEPAFVAMAQRKWRRHTPLSIASAFGEDIGLDAIPHVGMSLGNVLTHASAGLTARLGTALDADFGPAHIQPTLPGRASFESHFGGYMFVGLEGRAVARNIFLDGSTLAHSPRVTKKLLTGDMQVGASVFLGPVRLTYSEVLRTREFKAQRKPDRFGALSVTINF